MNILLVEDDNHKAAQVTRFLEMELDATVIVARSFHSGIQALTNNDFDLVLLDMSMPTYDLETGGVFNRHRNYAGEDFLYEMQNLEITPKTIILTQYDVIGEGKNQTDAKQLDVRYRDEFRLFYLGMVRYDASVSRWRDDLLEKLSSL